MKRSRFAVVFVFALLVALSQGANAQLFQVGGTYTLQGTNFVDNYSQTVTLDSAPQLVDSGQLLLTQTITPDGSGGDWLDINLSTVNDGPLAGNLGALWQLNFYNLPVVNEAVWDKGFWDWTVNGKLTSPLTTFSGFSSIEPDPINPTLGPVFNYTIGPYPPASTLDGYVFVTPYSAVTNQGINPQTTNGFDFAIHVRPAAVPEPGLLCSLLSLGLVGGSVAVRRRRRAN